MRRQEVGMKDQILTFINEILFTVDVILGDLPSDDVQVVDG